MNAMSERAARTTVYFDLSLSMVNFLDVSRTTGSQVPANHARSFQYGALLRRLPPILTQISDSVVKAGFSDKGRQGNDGRLRPRYDLTDAQIRNITDTECFASNRRQGRLQCLSLYAGNQRTDFSGLFPDVEARVDSGELVVIVSDLMSYNAGQAGDFNDVSGPLSGLIRQGKAVALLTAAVGYNGSVSDIPGAPIKEFAGKVPLHILVVGTSAQVAAALKAVDEDTAFRTFRANNPDQWHAVLFDRSAIAETRLGRPEVETPLPRGVLRTGGGMVEADSMLGQFIVGRSNRGEEASRKISIAWPVGRRNSPVPIDYDLQPDHQVWAYTLGGGRCQDGWVQNTDAVLKPDARPVGVSASEQPIRQTLFDSGVPFQLASNTVYLWRLGWRPGGVRIPTSEVDFLKTWSVDATGIDTLRDQIARRGGGGVFPTFDLAALYQDLWQAAYGANPSGSQSENKSALLSIMIQ
ncbi:hypothetical protein HL658_18665 [Azospirillum sp. RWY-5-1]|uniref:VWFA domain-containing protein n=1 Tax=Azospirillum oleiclasticum TaxID=2735135 RepID=A0ABX2TKV0_9PROT|nr:hypothetical protein [Azospirillum oleiclasticum]NYZ14577.1 hypothetical protein [Azospirillum oleiclasticum]NYZ24355.1 hypothetical protein [Azospirillum oleiclasticum]